MSIWNGNRMLRMAAQLVAIGGSVLWFLALPVAAQMPPGAGVCAKLRQHGDSSALVCYEKLTRSADRAVQAEGYWGLRDYKQANDLFRDAVAAKPKDPALRVRWGYLYLDHWQPAIASDCFTEAVELDDKYAPGYIGLAQVAAEGYSARAIEFAKHALALDPKAYQAEEVLARVALEDGNEVKAAEEANKALAMSPEAMDAMSILATIDWLNDKKTSPWLDKILKVNPHYGEAYDTAGHFFIINRRYEEGIVKYRLALELDPLLEKARAALGLNLMRLGREDEARAQLEQAWNAGYQPDESKNTLKLMDKYKDYDTFPTPTTILKLGKKESALLRPYFQAELDEMRARRQALNVAAPEAGRFLVSMPADLDGKFMRRGELIGYALDNDAATVRVIVPQSEIELVRDDTRGVALRFASDPMRVLQVGQISREVPTATRQLPSVALSSVGGGPIAVDPADDQHLRALEVVFQMDVPLPEGMRDHRIGERVHVRFEHGGRTLAWRISRTVRQLFLRRFDL